MTEEKESSLEFLLGAAETSEQEVQLGFEAGLLRRFLRLMGVPLDQQRKFRRELGTDLSFDWFMDTYPNFGLRLLASRVSRFSVQEFFERPTKTPVYREFTQHEHRPCCMFFKAKGFTSMGITNDSSLIDLTGVGLVFSTRNVRYLISTMEGLANAFRQRHPLVEG